MILLTLTEKATSTKLTLLVPDNTDTAVILSTAPDLFGLHRVSQAALQNLFDESYGQKIADAILKVAHLKGDCIGYPLDLHDAKLYALSKKIALNGELELNI